MSVTVATTSRAASDAEAGVEAELDGEELLLATP